jgi:Arc/MetJ family transcription regulator
LIKTERAAILHIEAFATLACVRERHVVPKNLKLNDKLIEAALKLGNLKSKQEAANTALAEFVHRHTRLAHPGIGWRNRFSAKMGL